MDLGGGSLQVVLGPIADQVAGRIRAGLHRSGHASPVDTVKLKVDSQPPAIDSQT